MTEDEDELIDAACHAVGVLRMLKDHPNLEPISRDITQRADERLYEAVQEALE